jgi:phospholipid transport system substrate-binding protein
MSKVARRTAMRFAALVALGLVTTSAPAIAPVYAAADPAALVSDLGKRAVDVLTSTSSQSDREVQFRKLFDEGFDVPGLSRFVLGPYWRSATPQQQQEFQKLFEAYEVHSYTVRFNQYSGQQLKVLSAQPQGDNATLVQSEIAKPGDTQQQPVKVDWRVAKTDGGDKIADVTIEGVSMAVTERQQFAAVIQRNGGQLEALLKVLRERASQG